MSKVYFYRETKFKKTEIGDIPEGWEVRKLGEIAHLEGGQSAPQGERYFQNGKYPFIRVQHISNEHKITGYDLINSEAIKDFRLKLFPKGSIIFPKSGASIFQEKRAILPFDSYVVSHLCVVIPDKGEANNLFLYYVLVRKKLAENISHNYPSLRISELGKVLIPLPPLEEQKAIAKVLKDFDDLIEVIDKKIETYKRIKKKLMEIYFTRGVFEHKTFKDTEIGRIPEGWEVKTLNSLLNSKKPLIKGRKPNQEGENLIPYINTEYLRNNKITEYSCLPTKEFLIKEEDILVLWDGSNAGEIFKGKYGVLGSTFVKLNFASEKKFYKFFLFYYLKYKAEPCLKLNTQGTGIPHVDRNILLNSKIPLPPLEEQKEIAKRLKAIDDQIENLKKQKEHLQKVKKKFMDLLLTGKLRVNL